MSAVAEKITQYYESHLSDLTEKQALFLQGLRETGVVLRACQRAGITRQLAYIWRSAYPEFKGLWDAALEDPVDEVEETLLQMAKSGNNVTATMSYLRHNRAKYRDESRIVIAKDDLDSVIEAAIAEHQLPQLPPAIESTLAVESSGDERLADSTATSE